MRASKTPRTNSAYPGLFHCPCCREYLNREMYANQTESEYGISAYCKKCKLASSRRKRFEENPHRYRSDVEIVECVLCKVKKQTPLMWRSAAKYRGDPVCIECKEKYFREYNTNYLPKYFVENSMKTCCRCKIKKPVAEFNKSKTSKTGLSTHCTVCEDQISLKYRLDHGLPSSKTKVTPGKTKRCSKCGEVFELEKFPSDKNKANGKSAHCKLCTKYYNSEQYKKGGSERALRWLKNLANERPLSLTYWKIRVKSDHFKGVDAEAARDLYIKDPHCQYCRLALRAWECQLDHKTPPKRGGGNTIENIAISCAPCNRAKWSMTEFEFRLYLKELRVRLNQVASVSKIIAKRCGEWNIQEIVSKAV